MKKLKSLQEENERIAQIYEGIKNPLKGNGIACPKCGSELEDVENSNCWMSGRKYPQEEIFCPNCRFAGFKNIVKLNLGF